MSISFSQLYVSLFESWIRILERFDYSFHHYSLLLPDKFLYCPRLHYYTGYCNLLDCWKTLWTTNGDPFHHCSPLLTDKKFYIVHGNVSILQHCSRIRFQQTFLRSRPPLLSASYWTDAVALSTTNVSAVYTATASVVCTTDVSVICLTTALCFLLKKFSPAATLLYCNS